MTEAGQWTTFIILFLQGCAVLGGLLHLVARQKRALPSQVVMAIDELDRQSREHRIQRDIDRHEIRKHEEQLGILLQDRDVVKNDIWQLSLGHQSLAKRLARIEGVPDPDEELIREINKRYEKKP